MSCRTGSPARLGDGEAVDNLKSYIPPPYIGDQDLWGDDAALREGVLREGCGWASDHLTSFGATTGSVENFDMGEQANRHHPELRPYDRHGMRINQVDYRPAYHDLMGHVIENEVPSFAW